MSILWFLIHCHLVLGHRHTKNKPLDPSFTIGDLNTPRCDLETCHDRQCHIAIVSSRLNRDKSVPCYCDHNCIIYGDCCYDYFELCLGVDISNVSEALTENLLNGQQAGMLAHKQCRPFGPGSGHFWFVSHCPRNSSVETDDILACEGNKTSILARIPVTVLQNPSITFLNIHCARCNGVKRNEVQFWNTTASCNKDIKIDQPLRLPEFHRHIMDGNCKLEISKTDNVDPRQCSAVLRSNPTNRPPNPRFEQDTSLMHKSLELCPVYIYPVLDQENNIHRNAHCAYANGSVFPLKCVQTSPAHPELTFSSLLVTDSPGNHEMQPTARPKPEGRPLVGSFSVMFNFGSNELTLEVGKHIIKVEKQCPKDNEVYVSYLERCDKVFCPHNMRAVKGTCHLKDKFVDKGKEQIFPKGSNIFVFELQVHGQKKVVKTQMEPSIRNALAIFLNADKLEKGSEIFVKSLSHMDIRQQNAGKIETEASRLTVEQGDSAFKIVMQTNAPMALIYRQIYSIYGYISERAGDSNVSVTSMRFYNFKTLKLPLNYDIERYFHEILSQNNSTCAFHQVPILFSDVKLEWNNDVLYVSTNMIHYKLDNVLFQIFIQFKSQFNSKSLVNVTDIVVCQHDRHKLPFCPQGMHLVDNSSFNLDNTSLILHHGEETNTMTFSPEQYIIQANGETLVCFPVEEGLTQSTVEFFQYKGIQDILTIVTTSISMVSLFISFLVYCALLELRNTPGKIVMALSATLFLAQGLQLLLSVPTGWMCVAVASLGHMTWLSTFMWMTVLSADLARSLRTMSPLSALRSSQKLFCTYAAIAWLLPAVFVTGCVLADHYKALGIDIGYGDGRICWIWNTMANLYIFGVPVALTLIVNCLCFVLTLVNIERTSSMVPSKTFKNEKTRLFIYFRLMLIMGLSWVFAFAAAFAKVELLWYFQIACNGMQGFAILLCFVCKPRIKRLLMTKFCLDKKNTAIDDILTTSTETGFSTT